jgi:hypothetical protein
MKRARSSRSNTSQLGNITTPYPVAEENYGDPYELMPSTSGLLTPLPEDNRPSKMRKHGSRFLNALRSLTNSGKYFRCLLFLDDLVSSSLILFSSLKYLTARPSHTSTDTNYPYGAQEESLHLVSKQDSSATHRGTPAANQTPC